MITRAGPDPPAPAELAKEMSRKRSHFGSPALMSENLLFLKQPLLAGLSVGISPPRGSQPRVIASQADLVCPQAPIPQHPRPPHQLSSEHNTATSRPCERSERSAKTPQLLRWTGKELVAGPGGEQT